MKQKTLSSRPQTFFADLSVRQLAVLRFYLDKAASNFLVTADQIYTITQKLSLSYRTVNRAFRELVAMGALIIVKKQFNGSNWVKIANQFFNEHWQREMYNWFSRFPILLVTLSMLFSQNPAACGELKIQSFKNKIEKNKREISKAQKVSMSNKATLIVGIREALRKRGFEITEEESCRLETFSHQMLLDACNLMKTTRDITDDKRFFFELLRELVAKDLVPQQPRDAAQQVKSPDSQKGDGQGGSVRKKRLLGLNSDTTASFLASGFGMQCAASLSHEDKELFGCLEAIEALEGLAKDPDYADYANHSLKALRARYERLTFYRRNEQRQGQVTVPVDNGEPAADEYLEYIKTVEDDWQQSSIDDMNP